MEILLESGTVKVEYTTHDAIGAWITKLYMKLGRSDFIDYTNCLELPGVRDKYTKILNEKLKA